MLRCAKPSSKRSGDLTVRALQVYSASSLFQPAANGTFLPSRIETAGSDFGALS